MSTALELAPGVRLALVVPAGSAPIGADRLPAFTLPRALGAEVVAYAGWRSDDATLLVACARASSSRWAPGVEELVLGRATDLARSALGVEVHRLDPGPVRVTDHRFEQLLVGEGRTPSVVARVRHVLGFVGDARDVLLCTTACVEPKAGRECAPFVEGASAGGAWVEPPRPSLDVQVILSVAQHPHEALVLGAALVMAITATVLARRPRPGRR